MLQRDRHVVPLDVIAHHRRGVLDAVGPFAISGVALGGVQVVADHDVNRHAVAVGVVDGHCRMLQPHCAVGEDAQRLAFNLGVAVGHADRRFFVAAGDKFGITVASIVTNRFM